MLETAFVSVLIKLDFGYIKETNWSDGESRQCEQKWGWKLTGDRYWKCISSSMLKSLWVALVQAQRERPKHYFSGHTTRTLQYLVYSSQNIVDELSQQFTIYLQYYLLRLKNIGGGESETTRVEIPWISIDFVCMGIHENGVEVDGNRFSIDGDAWELNRVEYLSICSLQFGHCLTRKVRFWLNKFFPNLKSRLDQNIVILGEYKVNWLWKRWSFPNEWRLRREFRVLCPFAIVKRADKGRQRPLHPGKSRGRVSIKR